jgi:glycosyltransferase involved in cell wall biosynthesis
MDTSREISVILPTYNRAGFLAGAIEALLNQDARGVTFEVIIVDNNSTDGTRAIVGDYVKRCPDLVKYVFEPRQGISHGRNTGIAMASGNIFAFTDDDVRASADWIVKLRDAFLAYPEAVYVGGRVLPVWEKPQPDWADLQLSSFAFQDHGDVAQTVDRNHQRCLVGANLACRRKLVERVGGFDLATQLVKGGIGSVEDHEWQIRIWAAGLEGKYVPDVQMHALVQSDRFYKSYHRRWHFGHGRFRAMLRDPATEATSYRILDTPGHVYRGAVNLLLLSCSERVQGRLQNAFHAECDAWDHLGFIFARWRGCLGYPRSRTKSDTGQA